MSRTGERRRIAAEALERPRKKRKSQSASLQPRPKPAKSRTPLSAHELAWKEIPTPERLDDAEGFLALEEVDHVDVVREDQGSQAWFLPRNPAHPPRAAARCSASKQSQSLVGVLQDDWEWSGFSEEEKVTVSEGQHSGENSTGRVYTRRNDVIEPSEDELQLGIPYTVLDHHTEHHDLDTSQWSGLGLSTQIESAIASLGFPRPTAIQTAVIPEVLAGHDVIGKAVTGSGKTLAFAIPMFEHWLGAQSAGPVAKPGHKKGPTGLILSPTRELVHQLARHFGALVEHAMHHPKIVTVTGGLSIYKQHRQLTGADFIIATPGRLWEMMNDSEDLVAGLKRVKFLVVDEADRLLSEGHFKEVEEILDLLDRQVIDEEGNALHAPDPEAEQQSRQVLVFSATLDKGLHHKLTSRSRLGGSESLNSNRQSMDYLLQKLSFREADPKFIDVNPNSQMAQRLQEGLVECSATEKDIYLYSILIQRPRAKVLVFTNSISSVRRLHPLLHNLNLPTNALHSSMPQKARLRNVERFSAPQSGGTILIATDVAARGLDIQNIDLILHYHVPRTADMYIHRSGRTARAEKAGESILLCSPDEVAGVSKLILQVHREEGAHHLQPIRIDRRLVARLSSRLALSRKITETTLAREKSGSQDGWLRTAAEELGVEYDSDDFAAEAARQNRGRGSTAKRVKEKEAVTVSRDELAAWRARLKQLLGQHVNLGVTERYVAGGAVDVDALLLLMDAEGERTKFLTRRGTG